MQGRATHFVDGKEFVIFDDAHYKRVRSENYNMDFCKDDGKMMRWGKALVDDPDFSPIGAEIADIEISVGCKLSCPFCYKENGKRAPENMSFADFKTIIDKFPKVLTQVAFGITGVQSNPDFIRMMEYCREIGIVPNFTLSGIDLTPELADRIAPLVGALAVSVYDNKDIAYNTVKMFTDRGVKQTNIHLLISKERLSHVLDVLSDIGKDERLTKLNAAVFLGLKPKGGGVGMKPVSEEEFNALATVCLKKQIPFGFDSCSAFKFQKFVRGISNLSDADKQAMLVMAEPCESSCFSSYINVRGEYWNCSFSEEAEGIEPVNVLKAEDFLKDVWYHPSVAAFRERVLATRDKKSCPVYNLD